MSGELTGALIGLGGAVFGAVLGFAASLWSSRECRIAESTDAFRAAVQSLVDLRITGIGFMREYADDVRARDYVNSAINNKRQLHKATAARIMSRVSSQLTADDYITLGSEYEADSEFENALDCYREALRKTADSQRVQRVTVLRSLGGLLLQPTRLQDRTKGETYFRDAIELTNGQTDDYSRYTTAYTYETLGMALLQNRFPEWRQMIDTAREYYEAMAPENELRQDSINNLNARLGTGPALPPPPTNLPRSPAEIAALDATNTALGSAVPKPDNVIGEADTGPGPPVFRRNGE
jgi:tetratricopeptide (TPR) repeat protein